MRFLLVAAICISSFFGTYISCEVLYVSKMPGSTVLDGELCDTVRYWTFPSAMSIGTVVYAQKDGAVRVVYDHAYRPSDRKAVQYYTGFFWEKSQDHPLLVRISQAENIVVGA